MFSVGDKVRCINGKNCGQRGIIIKIYKIVSEYYYMEIILNNNDLITITSLWVDSFYELINEPIEQYEDWEEV